MSDIEARVEKLSQDVAAIREALTKLLPDLPREPWEDVFNQAPHEGDNIAKFLDWLTEEERQRWLDAYVAHPTAVAVHMVDAEEVWMVKVDDMKQIPVAKFIEDPKRALAAAFGCAHIWSTVTGLCKYCGAPRFRADGTKVAAG